MGCYVLLDHPSGDPSPSAADVQLTRQLREAAAAGDIPLLDHVIIGRRELTPLAGGITALEKRVSFDALALKYTIFMLLWFL